MANEIDSLMKEARVFPPPETATRQGHIQSREEYERLYRESIESPDTFWARQAQEHLEWFKPWDSILSYDFTTIGENKNPYVQWFIGGKLNLSFNCLDRHVNSSRRNKAAIIWQGEADGDRRTLTYQQLHTEVCRFANVLKNQGVRRGSRVTIFLPMIPELPIAMLACARIGAIHSVVFSAFSPSALRDRILDCDSEIVITADTGVHGGKTIPLKQKTDDAIQVETNIRRVIVYQRGDGQVPMTSGRDIWWHDAMNAADISNICDPESMDAEDPLFILYTSGSTGKPKGVLHTTAGYLLYAHLTSRWIFDLKDEDIHWCTADIGWITGHSYIVYGPLSNGATALMFEGIPTYPQPNRFWKIIEDHRVSVFYTAPTAIRALMRFGDDWPNQHDLSSLRILGSVGEPINPEAWMWYYQVIGKERCPLLDTWWQTETGGILIAPLPGAIATKPGSASKPFFGIQPEILRQDGTKTGVDEGGHLVITAPWPGMIRGVYGDTNNSLIKNVYFSQFPGKYCTGDGCRVDEDGFYWLMGRIDDVVNVSGHRIGTAEVESALVSHPNVTEAAVVGIPHDIKGQGLYCFVTLKQNIDPTEALQKALVKHVREAIGPIATPDKMQFTDALPKTRSGKIVRRVLRKIAAGDIEELGDTSTLADPSLTDALVKGRVS
ncbi:MAG TPA: acetate--CoA ligase [Nitrospirales bacterium]|nr:acetate--CoA ligase [Nitrospirales bacterium]HIC04416.1 acetate--CoA ligase [Nitrospirales bacterium]